MSFEGSSNRTSSSEITLDVHLKSVEPIKPLSVILNLPYSLLKELLPSAYWKFSELNGVITSVLEVSLKALVCYLEVAELVLCFLQNINTNKASDNE